MKTDLVSHELHPRREFRIARARRGTVCNVFVRLESDGFVGWGEASPNAFYGETAERVTALLAAASGFVRNLRVQSIADIESTWNEIWELVRPSRAAQCAFDLALWDWLARRNGVTVAELAWGETARPVQTFCTIGLSTAAELEEKVAELDGFPLIKIKSDKNADLHPIRRVAERSKALIAVDANCAWSARDLLAVAKEIAPLGVAFIEQPLPPEEDAGMQRPPGMPVIADESCVVAEDVERVAQYFDGFNIKLVKCGGLTPALRMARRGRELGVRTMVGCMLESSVLIAAGAVVAQRTDYADLDGAWLLADDPFRGWEFTRGILSPPEATGLGVEPIA